MAKENGIRREQDRYACVLARRASLDRWASRRSDALLVPPDISHHGRHPGKDGTRELRSLPAFDRAHGTITAGNSSPLTDGASALLLISEEKAKAGGFDVLGFIRSYAFAAIDPGWQMLMGPSFATPLALERASATLKDMDLIDMHEAFAAQVLSNTQASNAFARKRDKAGKSIVMFNVTGGLIAIGHRSRRPARQITQTLNSSGGARASSRCARRVRRAARAAMIPRRVKRRRDVTNQR
jgi:acetyl-CoA acyltransferase